MKVSEAKKLARLSKWQQLVNQQKASGLSIRCWCEQNALTEQLGFCKNALTEQLVRN